MNYAGDRFAAHKRIFRSGSKTYFTSSLFFPAAVRRDVFCLYSFVRVADNYVDAVPQQAEAFHRFCDRYRAAQAGTPAGDQVIDPFVELSRRCHFDPAWTEAFLQSMAWDLSRSSYATIGELLEYIYGSAEVIGLYMAAILGLAPEARDAAMQQGRAMQLINFVRDVAEDNGFGRRYLPTQETTLSDLSETAARSNPEEFCRYIRFQVDRYLEWQNLAEQGYAWLPRRYRIPVAAAADMYSWTARRIARDPFVVFRRKLKPSTARIILAVLRRAIISAFRNPEVTKAGAS
ncbi:phytoene/squalene synthase family protein [Spirochaeta africana]|uniref:Phytoene/squalene synthetase n=1 Tax=Spirochaeta africana (strain ATCC 700263 / DSM 8902 / Z-7692) TaxID=889378 RepID=H9UJM6_SPIAZ|nr:phytoene/squalene synthase family protein [Spirochaeta africana]AFG37719.1 phytoene/squalene synthetase [Spirochaeta africana DSM 8902]